VNRRVAEEKARQIASHIFSNATMRAMLCELIVEAFCPSPDYPPNHHMCVPRKEET
jgi:hypothetical protein